MLNWDGNEVILGDIVFRSSLFSGLHSTAERFIVWKTREMIDQLANEIDDLRPKNIVEIGIAEGGSTALLAELCKPTKLVALDIRTLDLAPLAQYVEGKGLAEVVKPIYGIDQADPGVLTEIIDREFGTTPLDLVIDDASHQLLESRASFNVLFPRLRPGGVYIIEDWTWGHKKIFQAADQREADLAVEFHWPTGAPLSIMIFELVMTMASHEGLIDELRIDETGIHIRRGTAPIGPAPFDLARSYRPGGVTISVSETS